MWRDNPRQPPGNGGKADDGEIVDRKQADEARGGHLAAADAGEPHRFGGTLPQRPHQRGAEPVAGFLGGDQENLDLARPQPADAAARLAPVIGPSHRRRRR